MLTQEEHKTLGIDLFNAVWDLLDRRDRIDDEKFEMIHAAHASAYHWLKAGGTAVNEARSQWQISRVYAVLGMGEAALVHGLRSLELCRKNAVGGFDLAFGYEAVARAYAVLKNTAEKDKAVAGALAACADIADEEDRKYVEGEINTIV